MTVRHRAARALPALVAALCLPLAACGELNSAVDKADGAVGKASACSEALGIAASFNPQALDPQRVQEEAARKANRLQELAGQAADADLRQSLLAVADGYVELERRQTEGLANLTDWVRRNTENLDRLRQVCL
ncbi:hypothetical protein [Amycolatopsis arida]|nr:hypothetical protein [Amycolatopsis arida]